MKRLKVLLVGCFAAAIMAVSMSGCSSSQDYTPPAPTPSVSTPVILEEGVLKVGVNAANAPLAGQPTNSTKIVGIDVDIAAAIADSMGLKLEIIDVGSDPEAALSEGRVDVVMGVDNADGDYSFWCSESYIPTGIALFTASGAGDVSSSAAGSEGASGAEGAADGNAAEAATSSAPIDDSSISIAAQLSSKSAWAAANVYQSANLITTDTLESAFSALSEGEVQYVASDMVVGMYAAHSKDRAIEVVALLQPASGYSIGVNSENAELQQLIADAVAELTGNGIISAIEAKWLGMTMDVGSIPLAEGAAASHDSEADDSQDGSDEGLNASGDGSESGSQDSDTSLEGTDAALQTAEADGSEPELNEVASNAVVL